jgi:Leucine-rich repeat (LRR) protein
MLNPHAGRPALHGFERLTKLVLSANSLQQLPDTPDSPALRELRLDGNQIRQAGRIADPGLTSSGARLRLLDLSGNPLDDSADAIGSLSQVCMQLEVLSLNAPVGVNADCLAESQWAASLHHLPRLKTVNGKKWKRDKAKAPAQSNSPPKVAGDTSGGTRPHPSCATTPAAATDALREVLGGLGRHQLVRLIESMGAGVNLAKELRRLQAAGSADARNSSEVPESNLLSAGSEPVSKKKTTDRLTKKLGPDPMESDIAVITKRKAKKKHLKKRKEGHGDEM